MSRRPRHPMPDFVREALEAHELAEAYGARPPYQRNDYLGWIARAKREETRQRRLARTHPPAPTYSATPLPPGSTPETPATRPATTSSPSTAPRRTPGRLGRQRGGQLHQRGVVDRPQRPQHRGHLRVGGRHRGELHKLAQVASSSVGERKRSMAAGVSELTKGVGHLRPTPRANGPYSAERCLLWWPRWWLLPGMCLESEAKMCCTRCFRSTWRPGRRRGVHQREQGALAHGLQDPAPAPRRGPAPRPRAGGADPQHQAAVHALGPRELRRRAHGARPRRQVLGDGAGGPAGARAEPARGGGGGRAGDWVVLVCKMSCSV